MLYQNLLQGVDIIACSMPTLESDDAWSQTDARSPCSASDLVKHKGWACKSKSHMCMPTPTKLRLAPHA